MGDEVRDAILRLPNCPNSVCLATNYWSRRGPSLSVGSEEQTELLPVAHLAPFPRSGHSAPGGGGRAGAAGRGRVRERRRAPEPEKRRKERAEERQGHDANGRRNTT